MSKELRSKKDVLVKQLNDLNNKLTSEGRAQFSADEKAAFDKIKADLAGITEAISAFDLAEEAKAEEAERMKKEFAKNPNKRSKDEDAFGSTLRELRNAKFEMSMDEFEQRATVTTSSNSQWKFTDMADMVSISEPDLVLEAVGGKVAYFKEGNVQYPAMSHIVGTFGTEDNQISDQTLTTAQTLLSPQFVSASIEVSKAFIVQSKAKNINELKNALVYAVKKAVEKRALTHLTGATTVGTVTGTTSYARATHAESLIIGTGTGLIAGTNAVKRMKQEKQDAGSGIFTWTSNEVNGYPAKRSILAPVVNGVYFGDFSSVVQAYFGDALTIEVITDGTMARKGNVLLIASCMADAKCVDFGKVAYYQAV